MHISDGDVSTLDITHFYFIEALSPFLSDFQKLQCIQIWLLLDDGVEALRSVTKALRTAFNI